LKLSKLAFGDLVSVVIPAYNHASFIRAALDSVYVQTYPNIELILLDDCSKDRTLGIAKEWAAEKKASERFVRVIIEANQGNLGAHDTINKGLALAQGNALTVLNSDDLYVPTRLEILLQQAEKHQADWLFSGIRVVDEKGARVYSEFAIGIETSIDFAANFPAVGFALLKKNIAVTTGNLFFSRDLYEKVGPFKKLKYCHDWDFALQACLYSEPLLVEDSLYLYRIHGANSFASLHIEQHLESQIVYRNYFTKCQTSKCINFNAPSSLNWPMFFDSWIAADPVLSWGFDLVVGNAVKYDRLAQAINHSINHN
jgi:glycosyltransferase involved in cell wall biosynthesis